MRGQIKTGTTMLNNIKERVKYLGSFLFGNEGIDENGYTNYEDIPDPTIENFPDEINFIKNAGRITSQIEGKTAKNKIVKTSRNRIEENELINKQAQERRKKFEMSVNENQNQKERVD